MKRLTHLTLFFMIGCAMATQGIYPSSWQFWVIILCTSILSATDCPAWVQTDRSVRPLKDRVKAAIKAFKHKPADHTECGHNDCITCAYKREFESPMTLPNCHNCVNKRMCTHKPDLGEYLRINCPLHRPEEKNGDHTQKP